MKDITIPSFSGMHAEMVERIQHMDTSANDFPSMPIVRIVDGIFEPSYELCIVRGLFVGQDSERKYITLVIENPDGTREFIDEENDPDYMWESFLIQLAHTINWLNESNH